MLRVILVCGALFGVMRGTAAAQTPNGGAINVSAGMDVPSAYVYRGILQEGDPKLTLTPFGQVSIRLSGDPGPASTDGTRINVGVWNGLLTGTSGSGGPLKRIHYAEQFSASVSFGVGHGIVVSPGYLANTSPNRGYNTVKEFTLNVGATGAIAPYGFLAVELDDAGQMDGGSKKGTYLELGAVPSFGLSLWHSRLSVPVRAGFSLSNYYELFESTLTFNDHPFGFVEVGGHLTVPVSSSASRFGTWNVHGGVDFFSFGDTTRAFNLDEKTRVVVSGGVALLY
jgi:hypothetical protein